MKCNIPFGDKFLAVISTHGYYTIHERVGDTEEYRPVIKGLTDEFGCIYYPITDDIYGEPETDSERDALAQMLATHITLSEGQRYDMLIKTRMEWMRRLLGREVSESEVTDRDSWYGLWEEAYADDSNDVDLEDFMSVVADQQEKVRNSSLPLNRISKFLNDDGDTNHRHGKWPK